MTRQEFISRKQASQNVSGKQAVIAVLLVVIAVLFVIGVWDPLSEFVESHVKPASTGKAISVALKVVVILFVLGSFGLLVLYLKSRMKQFGLICPGCGKPLMVGKGVVGVISTGQCGYCGAKVLDDASINVASVKFITISDFLERKTSHLRVMKRVVLIFLFTVIGSMAEMFLLCKRMGSYVGFDAISIVAILVSIPVVAVLIFYAVVMPDKRMRQLGLICPTCGEPLGGAASWSVINTGCCGSCGCQILDILPPPNHS